MNAEKGLYNTFSSSHGIDRRNRDNFQRRSFFPPSYAMGSIPIIIVRIPLRNDYFDRIPSKFAVSSA
jgi:hypothetical protein